MLFKCICSSSSFQLSFKYWHVKNGGWGCRNVGANLVGIHFLGRVNKFLGWKYFFLGQMFKESNLVKFIFITFFWSGLKWVWALKTFYCSYRKNQDWDSTRANKEEGNKDNCFKNVFWKGKWVFKICTKFHVQSLYNFSYWDNKPFCDMSLSCYMLTFVSAVNTDESKLFQARCCEDERPVTCEDPHWSVWKFHTGEKTFFFFLLLRNMFLFWTLASWVVSIVFSWLWSVGFF